jgi:hypothetical protein
MEEQSGISFYYAEPHLQMSPEAVHDGLSCSNDSFYAQHNTSSLPLYKTPWDMDLFWHALPFLKGELRAAVCVGWEESVFWNVLYKMRPANTKIKWTPVKYLESAKLAERRAQQLPWGELLPNPKRIRPNWTVEAMIQAAAMDRTTAEQQLCQDQAAKHADHNGDDYVELKSKPLRTMDDYFPTIVSKKQRCSLKDYAQVSRPLAQMRYLSAIDDSSDRDDNVSD